MMGRFLDEGKGRGRKGREGKGTRGKVAKTWPTLPSNIHRKNNPPAACDVARPSVSISLVCGTC